MLKIIKKATFALLFLSMFFMAKTDVFATSLTDSFTDTAGVLLDSHTSDSGNTWTKTAGTGSVAITNANRIRGNTTAASIYVSNWTPPTADYDVSTDVYIASNPATSGTQFGIGGRVITGAFNGYYVLLYTNNASLNLFNASTLLATYNLPTLQVGQTYTLKLSMLGNLIKVYWDSSPVISVTVSGSNIIGSIGSAAFYASRPYTDSTGDHFDNFLATKGLVTAGTLSNTSYTETSAILAWTAGSNGTAPITTQLQRSASGANSWSDVSGATTSPATDTGLSASTSYDYRVAYTDAVPTTVYSNTVSLTTDFTGTTYTALLSDLWDNGYNNITAPRQSPLSRVVFTTNASQLRITGTTTFFPSYGQFAHLGLRVDGVDQSSMAFTATGAHTFRVDLGVAGITRTIEIVSGAVTKPTGFLSSDIDSITYPVGSTFSLTTPTVGSRIVVYGDSISVGANATNPESQGYIALLRNTYGYRVMSEGWGFRALYDDAHTTPLRTTFVSRISSYSPITILLAIGTNDYGLSAQNATNFGTAYAATVDDLHTSLPSARIICQTPIVRTTETANTYGNTLADYRSQITSICNARAWATTVDGSVFLTTANLDDGVHPSTAGHAKYAKRLAPLLASTGFTVSGPTSGQNSQASTVFTATISSANFMGDQTVIITASSGTINATAIGGTVTNNNTSAVTVSPADGQTSFTFIYTPNAEGVNTLTFTNGQNWINPSVASYSADGVAPSGGSIDYTNGYLTSTSVTLTANDGTDSNSGVNTGSRIIQRKSATLSDGTCGSYSSFATITPTGTYPNLTDSTVVSGNCYVYQYLISDNVSNQTTYTSANIAKIDISLPTTPLVSPMTTPTNLLSQTWSWSTVTDLISGVFNYIWRTTGTAILTGTSITNSVATSLSDGVYNFFVRGVDNAGNQGDESLAGVLTIDSTAPTISSVSSNTPASSGTTITWITNEDSSSKVDYGLTNSYGSSTSESDTSPRVTNHSVTLSSLSSCTIYHYRVRSKDAVTNERIDTDNIFTTTGCTTPTTAPSNNVLTPASSPTCNDSPVGSKVPWLYSAIAHDSNSILLHFTQADNPVTKYVLEFGTSSGEYQYGVQDMGINEQNQMTYLVKYLSANTTYYFRIRGQNGCSTGEWSNEISIKTLGLFSVNKLQTTNISMETVKTKEVMQTGYVVNVKVIDTNQNPVIGAKVTLHSDPKETTTDKDGIAHFANVESGSHKVLIAYNNFTGEQSINLTGDIKEFNLNITVNEKKVLVSPFATVVIAFLVLIIVGLFLKLKKIKPF